MARRNIYELWLSLNVLLAVWLVVIFISFTQVHAQNVAKNYADNFIIPFKPSLQQPVICNCDNIHITDKALWGKMNALYGRCPHRLKWTFTEKTLLLMTWLKLVSVFLLLKSVYVYVYITPHNNIPPNAPSIFNYKMLSYTLLTIRNQIKTKYT